MKRIIFLLFACMLIHTGSRAQNPNNGKADYSLTDDGITWYYNLYEATQQDNEWVWDTVMGDSIINGRGYKKVYEYVSSQNVRAELGNVIGVFRQEGSNIYIPYDPNLPFLQKIEDEMLLYDFSLEQGDLFGAQTNASNTFKVADTEKKTYRNRTFKLMHLTSPQISTNETWIENVGSKDHYFLDPFGYNTVNYYDCKLIDLKKDKEIIYHNPLFSSHGNRGILFADPETPEAHEHPQTLNFEFSGNTLVISGYMFTNCCGYHYLTYETYSRSIYLERYEEGAECDCEGTHEMRPVRIPNCDGDFYRVILADYHGTNGLDTMIYRNPYNIIDAKTLKIKVYPNPMKEQAVLEFSNPDKEPFSFQLIDGTGKTVLTRKGITNERIIIKKENLPSGIYFYRLFNSNQEYSDKLLIE